MVRILTFLILLITLALLAAIDVGAWLAFGWTGGVAGLCGIIGFLIAYAVSVEVAIAPRDFWTHSDFGLFLKKLGYAWETGLCVTAASFLIFPVNHSALNTHEGMPIKDTPSRYSFHRGSIAPRAATIHLVLLPETLRQITLLTDNLPVTQHQRHPRQHAQ